MKESIGNIGLLHKECSLDRRKQWQKNNKDLVIKVGSFVKICFTQGKENEWMWVKVTSVSEKNRSLRGILDNDPFVVTNVSCGDEVLFTRNEISQYLPS